MRLRVRMGEPNFLAKMSLFASLLIMGVLPGRTALADLPAAAPAAVPASAPAPAEVEQLAEKFAESKQRLVDSENQKRKILGSLYSINYRMKKISQEKNHLTDELFQVQDNVKNIAKLIADIENQIAVQKTKLRKRLRALYKLSGEGYLGAVFTADSSLEFDQTLKFLKIITENDYQLIRSYQQNIAEYKGQRRKLKGQVERLLTLEKKIKRHEDQLLSEHNAKTRMVSELEKTKTLHMTRIEDLRKQSRQIESAQVTKLDERLVDLLKPSFFEQKGQLASPIQGEVVQDFGLLRDDKNRIKLSHKGWQYKTNKGTPIHVVFDGKVVFADWINGYGNTIIVDHGDHYYTVYAYVGRRLVTLGQEVHRQQTIADAGSSSRRFGAGVYFEIRHFSEPENPAHWILPKSVKISSLNSSSTDYMQGENP